MYQKQENTNNNLIGKEVLLRKLQLKMDGKNINLPVRDNEANKQIAQCTELYTKGLLSHETFCQMSKELKEKSLDDEGIKLYKEAVALL